MDRLAHCPHNKAYAREGNYKSFQEIAVALNKSGVPSRFGARLKSALYKFARRKFAPRNLHR